MRIHLSLTSKVLLFIIAPLIAQFALLVHLATIEREAEDALSASTKCRKISDKIHQIASDIFELHKSYRTLGDLEKYSFADTAQSTVAKLKADYTQLKKLTRGQSEIYETVVKSEKVVDRSLDTFREIQHALTDYGKVGPTTRAELMRRFRRTTAQDEVFQDLIEIGKQQELRAEDAPEVQAVYRQQSHNVMLTIGIVNLLFGAVFSLFLIKGIISRLQQVRENTFKLASGMPLNPPLQGTDEIAALDQVFHKMASAIRETSRKQSAIVENARDLICTIDEQGRFETANGASVDILGIAPADLLGKHFIDLVVSEDVSKALSFFEQLKTSSEKHLIELQMRSASPSESLDSSSLVETIWSAHWSDENRSTFCVIHDITERRRAERLKQEVMAMITHDLRTPLSVINNVLNFFESGVGGTFDTKGERYLKMASRNVDRMFTLTNELLDIEKIKSGTMKLEISAVSLSRTFEECAAVSGGYAEEKGVSLVFEPTDIMLDADDQRLDRVLANLVANAIKFSPKGKTVRVSSSLSPVTSSSNVLNSAEVDKVIIRVEDEGQGIPPEFRESVFERFQQVDGSSASGKIGSGLGLTICKAIVELHGGRIWVEDKTGNGTIFAFSLPLTQNI